MSHVTIKFNPNIIGVLENAPTKFIVAKERNLIYGIIPTAIDFTFN